MDLRDENFFIVIGKPERADKSGFFTNQAQILETDKELFVLSGSFFCGIVCIYQLTQIYKWDKLKVQGH